MSAAAAMTATLPEVAEGGGGIPRQRGLRPVPAGGQCDGKDVGDALRLGREMRLRLRAAVLALVADPSLAGLKDAPRLAAVVLYAKSRAPEGRKDDNQTSIWGPELGRWLGMSESTVHHKVLPALRRTDALHTRVVTDSKGQPTGLDCLVMPLWNARRGGGAAHPLALSKVELAVLLRLCEALFGPGWAPENREPTPPGLLAGRTGKGAATDRLGLLLMVLSTRASGWLQLCGGSVKKRDGRGAATLARLLGCSPSGARKVLARLGDAGVVARERKATSTRMNGRGRVMLLPVARAYGRVLAPMEVAPVEVVQGPETVPSRRPNGAGGDHAPSEGDGALGTSGMCEVEGAGGAGVRERPDGAGLHADHTPVDAVEEKSAGSGGFSGEAGVGVAHRGRERACAREDHASCAVGRGRTPVQVAGAAGDALRAEEPTPIFPPSSRLSLRVPQVRRLLAEVVPRPNEYRQSLLARLLEGLLREGEDDALIAARLRTRLAPLATGDPARPYRFRRDGFSWAITVGLPYTPGGLTLLPCRNRRCSHLVRAKANVPIRCDACELAVYEATKAHRDSRLAPADVVAPPPPLEVLVASLPSSAAASPDAAAPLPEPPSTGPTPSDAGPAGPDPWLPASVAEQIDLIRTVDVAAADQALTAAHILYGPGSSTDTAEKHRDRVTTASARFFALTSRYSHLLTPHYAGSAA